MDQTKEYCLIDDLKPKKRTHLPKNNLKKYMHMENISACSFRKRPIKISWKNEFSIMQSRTTRYSLKKVMLTICPTQLLL